jgi:hypothetical protein
MDYDHAHESYSSYDACACDGSNCECVNDDSTTDTSGTECGDYSTSSCSGWDNPDFTAATQCCHCTGGGTTAYTIPDFLDHGTTAIGWCYSEWDDCYDPDTTGVSTHGGAWSFCAQKADAKGKSLVAGDVDHTLFCCQDACDCMAEGHGNGYEVITLDTITDLPTECAPTPAPTAALCTGEDYEHAGDIYSSYDVCACDGSDCACVNDDTTTDSWGFECGQYSTSACSGFDDDDFTAATQCCHCKDAAPAAVDDDDAAGKVGPAAIIAGTAILLLMA